MKKPEAEVTKVHLFVTSNQQSMLQVDDDKNCNFKSGNTLLEKIHFF